MISSFILQFNFNKFEASLLWAPLENQFTLGNATICIRSGLVQSFAKCPLLSQLKHLTLEMSYFEFFAGSSLPIDFSLLLWSPSFLWLHLCLLQLLLQLFKLVWFLWVTLLLVSPWGMEGLLPLYTPPFSSSFGGCSGYPSSNKRSSTPKALNHVGRSTFSHVIPSKGLESGSN